MAPSTAETKTPGWKNRIVGFEAAGDPEQLLFNPANWRIHPKAQQAALEGVLDEVGWVQAAVVNITTGHLVDGHMRAERAMARGETIPIIQIEVSADEEKQILASLDPIGDLATQDDSKLRELLGDVKAIDAEFHQMLTDAVDFGDQAMGTAEASDGSLLALINVTISEPQHQVVRGDVWKIGHHILVCADVEVEWALWVPYLAGEARFAGYPGPLVPLTRKADTVPLVMVQPDPYIAGHILDRSADVYGGAAIAQIRRGHVEPTAEELEPTPVVGRVAKKKAKRQQ